MLEAAFVLLWYFLCTASLGGIIAYGLIALMDRKGG